MFAYGDACGYARGAGCTWCCRGEDWGEPLDVDDLSDPESIIMRSSSVHSSGMNAKSSSTSNDRPASNFSTKVGRERKPDEDDDDVDDGAWK
jgi:hypothetical protein